MIIMKDLRIEPSLSIEEIEGKFKDVDFFAGIMDGLQDALSHEKGEVAAAQKL